MTLTAGQSYLFRVIARNSVGTSLESDKTHTPVLILVAQISAQPLPPTTTRDFNKITITWQEPVNFGSTPITNYTIEIRQADNTTFSQTAECNGALVTIRDTRICSVLTSTLVAPPFSLAWGQSVFARVAATNIKGTSSFSVAGNGDVVVINPDKPTNLANVPSITTASQIGLSWLEGTTFYGKPVLDYTLSYD